MTISKSFDLELGQHRQQFPGLANKVYFNYGGQGLLPAPSWQAIIDAYQYIDKIGAFSLKANNWIKEQTILTKKAIADEIGATPETITLTENVTAGCNIVLWGIDWQPHDHILITDCEHPGIIGIVKEIAYRFGVEVSTCPIIDTLNQGCPISVIAEYLQPNTRLVIISHLLWNTGQVLPLKEIVKLCHEYPHRFVQVLVDAAQSVGCLPLNLIDSKVDFYAFTGHKWLCGAAGVGGLYISQKAINSIRPTFVGWRGLNLDQNGLLVGYKEDGGRFEVATSAYPLYGGLTNAIAIHQQWGTSEKRYQIICQLAKYIWQGLSEINQIHCLKNSAPTSGLVSFKIINNQIGHEQLVKELERKEFLVRKIAHPDCVRVCVHYFSLEAEIEQLLTTLKIILN